MGHRWTPYNRLNDCKHGRIFKISAASWSHREIGSHLHRTNNACAKILVAIVTGRYSSGNQEFRRADYCPNCSSGILYDVQTCYNSFHTFHDIFYHLRALGWSRIILIAIFKMSAFNPIASTDSSGKGVVDHHSCQPTDITQFSALILLQSSSR